ncbi:hypothetical protein HQ520_04965 [bacterium]|nr:hypothetical protein [bacterium]
MCSAVPRMASALILLTLLAGLSGCSYLSDRGRDALDIFDLGITITPEAKPDFAIYFDFFNMLPVGYGNVDGKMIGWGNRQMIFLDDTPLDYTLHSWGALVWGSEKYGTGSFIPADPRQVRDDQRDLLERPRYNAGVARVISEEENRPPWTHYFECQRALHLGWIGIVFNLRPLDVVDFVVGWTTVDFMGDDHLND